MITPQMIVAGVVAALCAWGGWQANGVRLEAKYTAERLEQELVVNRQLIAQQREHDDKATEQANIAATEYAKLRKAQNETNRYRACLADGTCGLRIDATCPGTTGTETAQGGGVDSGAGAQLNGAARQAYSALRDGITSATAKLAACQRSLSLYQ